MIVVSYAQSRANMAAPLKIEMISPRENNPAKGDSVSAWNVIHSV